MHGSTFLIVWFLYNLKIFHYEPVDKIAQVRKCIIEFGVGGWNPKRCLQQRIEKYLKEIQNTKFVLVL